MTPARDPKQSFFVNQFRKSWNRKNHKEGTIWEASGRLLERHLERHLGDIWETSGKHLGSIWEASGSHLGAIWEHLEAIWEPSGSIWEPSGKYLDPRRLQEVWEASGEASGETSWRPLGDIWEASGPIWEPSGNHLGAI